MDSALNSIWKIFRYIIAAAFIGWALYLIWHGTELYETGEPEMMMGGLTLIVGGLFWLVPDLIGFVYDRMKARAPAKPGERPTEPTDLEFDADAALARYLANRKAQPAAPAEPVSPAPASPAATASVRPVFGRRGNPA